MKRRDLITVTIITLLVIRLALISVSGTYAKYTTGATGSSTTYVAKWNVKVNEIDSISISGVTTIGSYAFQNCVKITTIEIPSSIT